MLPQNPSAPTAALRRQPPSPSAATSLSLREAQAQGKGVAFPNDFKPAHHAADLQAQYAETEAETLEANPVPVSVAGRMMLKRVMGKASFATVQDGSLGATGGRIQLYVTRDAIGEEAYAAFKHWDLGDIVGAEGTLMKTKTGELSVKVTTLRLLTKSLRPMPDKFHGVADQEVKYRQRYVDLMTDEAARKRFIARSKAVSGIREFMVQHGFLEVETPMLHPIPGGANAKPFVTHHNALEQEMYLRIAPELYLKRLVVGGFERVFEINRNFRNEGISVRHNPEFTMMEFYAAYWNYRDLMDFTEQARARCGHEGGGQPAADLPGPCSGPVAALRAPDHPRGHPAPHRGRRRRGRCRLAGRRAAQAGSLGGEGPPVHAHAGRPAGALLRGNGGGQALAAHLHHGTPDRDQPAGTRQRHAPRGDGALRALHHGPRVRQRLLRFSTTRKTRPHASSPRWKPRTAETTRPCISTTISSAPSNTACLPPVAAASASTGL